jgi:hypothetical protein
MAENERIDDLDDRSGGPYTDAGQDADIPNDPLLDWDEDEGDGEPAVEGGDPPDS